MYYSQTKVSNIVIILVSDSPPNLFIELNGQYVENKILCDDNQKDTWKLLFSADLKSKNEICVHCANVNNYIKVEEVIVDGINFGLVTFLCTNVENKQGTQLNKSGTIKIELEFPIWKFWCEKMNDFNYERYPLGSTD